MQGGTVYGGSGSFTIKDIKVMDSKTVSGTLVGKVLWVQVSVNGIAQDGVLLPGCNVTAATCSVTSTVGEKVPDNTLPTAKSPEGKKIHIEIGRWNDKNFSPSRQGNINVQFCPGSYSF